jgi:hypothetical protein
VLEPTATSAGGLRHRSLKCLLAAIEVLPVDRFTNAAIADPASLQAAVFNIGGWLGIPPATPPAYTASHRCRPRSRLPAA